MIPVTYGYARTSEAMTLAALGDSDPTSGRSSESERSSFSRKSLPAALCTVPDGMDGCYYENLVGLSFE